MRVRVLYYFISTHDFQIGAPAPVAGIGATPVPSRPQTNPPEPYAGAVHEKTEIDSESSEVTVFPYRAKSRRDRSTAFTFTFSV